MTIPKIFLQRMLDYLRIGRRYRLQLKDLHFVVLVALLNLRITAALYYSHKCLDSFSNHFYYYPTDMLKICIQYGLLQIFVLAGKVVT